MAFVPLFLLVTFLFLRPMDLSPTIAKLHSLETLTALSTLGAVAERLFARLRNESAAGVLRGSVREGLTPQLPWLLAFFGWMYIVTIAHLGGANGLKEAWSVTLGPLFMVIVIFVLGEEKRLRAMMIGLIISLGLITAVCVHQGLKERECIELKQDPNDHDSEPDPIPDGRECVGARFCELESEGGNPGSDYVCERVGLFRTYSTGGRVRWRGQLDDPNEVAVMVGALLPFALLFARKDPDRPPGPLERAVTLLAIGIYLVVSLWAAVYTQSRGGQIVIAVALVTVLVRRFGWKALLIGAVLTAPLVALSWRSGADAESSSVERAEILAEGLGMLRDHPILGLGVAQFARENPMNMAAHNSYLLVACEGGVLGSLLWCGMVWTTIKMPFVIARRPPPGLRPSLVRFAEALSASVLALHFGVFFLSFVYKTIYFVWLGLSGALFVAVRAEHPDYRISFTRRDAIGIVALSVFSLIAVRIAAGSAH